jgi:RimJ/RimL family protein N-acetyltransferase
MIKGEKITLCGVLKSDSKQLFGWINDPTIVRFSSPFSPVHETNHDSWLASVLADTTRIVFTIRDVTAFRLMGLLQLINIHPIHRSAELIIRIGEETDRSRGAGSEAVRLAVDFAFRDLNLQRVWLTVFADNVPAIRAYEKAGMKNEGVLRRAYFVDGRWRDANIMARLSDEHEV